MPIDTTHPNERLLAELQDKPWAVVDSWLSPDLLRALHEEALGHFHAANMRPAGVGRGSAHQVIPAVRSDFILWLDPRQPTATQAALWQALDELRVQLNRRFFLGLKRFEGHYAVYPQGAHYNTHIDQFRDAGHRRVSFVLYLNPAWSPDMGGALRIYERDTPQAVATDILPAWGRAVVFFSDNVPHEVLTTHAERFSFTGWFRDDAED